MKAAWACALTLGCSLSQELGATSRDAGVAPDASIADDAPRELAPTYSVVAAGGARTCALSAGYVQCWGDSLHGGLGRDATSPDPRPTAVPGVASIERVALGRDHACAAGGSVWCWGDAREGRRGIDPTRATTAPNTVPGVERVDRLVAGLTSSCARDGAGVWWCWGPWGVPETPYWFPQPVPTTHAELDGADAVGIGTAHLCGLWRRGDGAVVRCRGVNVNGQLGAVTGAFSDALVDFVDDARDETVTLMAVGARHTCVVSRGGTRVTCRGALAGGPGHVAAFTSDEAVVSLATGEGHVCFVTVSGAARCWGDNASGQLGDGTLDARDAPVRVAAPEGVQFADVTCGVSHTCARERGGAAVWCWGDNRAAQLGAAASVSARIPARVDAR